MLNFNWWVNRKDPSGRNVFAGGFLGLDNIGVFDRSAQLPTGGSLEQADGTAWMAFYCQCMLEIALILCEYDPMYEEVAFKFVQHFMWIAYAMDRIGEHHDKMWDEEDGFFYDVLRLPDGSATASESAVDGRPSAALRVHRLRGVMPPTQYPKLMEMIALFKKRHPELVSHVAPTDTGFHRLQGTASAVVSEQRRSWNGCSATCSMRTNFWGRMESVPRRATTSTIRSSFWVGGQEYKVQYLPAESEHGHVRRQLQLARTGVDACQHADRSRTPEPVRVLRR